MKGTWRNSRKRSQARSNCGDAPRMLRKIRKCPLPLQASVFDQLGLAHSCRVFTLRTENAAALAPGINTRTKEDSSSSRDRYGCVRACALPCALTPNYACTAMRSAKPTRPPCRGLSSTAQQYHPYRFTKDLLLFTNNAWQSTSLLRPSGSKLCKGCVFPVPAVYNPHPRTRRHLATPGSEIMSKVGWLRPLQGQGHIHAGILKAKALVVRAAVLLLHCNT